MHGILQRHYARNATAARTPASVDATDTPSAPAPLEPVAPVALAVDPEPVRVADPLAAAEPEREPVAVADPLAAVDAPVAAGKSVNRAADWRGTQFEDAGILGS